MPASHWIGRELRSPVYSLSNLDLALGVWREAQARSCLPQASLRRLYPRRFFILPRMNLVERSRGNGQRGNGPKVLRNFQRFSETGRIRFRGVRFQTPNSVSFFGLTEFRGASSVSFLSAYYLCAKANSPSLTQNSPILPQNSVGSLLRNSTLETVFRPFPRFSEVLREF